MKMRNLIAAFVAALSIGTGLLFALDNSATAQQRPAARQNVTQQTNFYRKTVNYNDGFQAGNVSLRFGRLPNNASIVRYSVDIQTAFVGGIGGTNRIYIGAGNFASGTAAAVISGANYVLASQTDGGIVGGNMVWTSGTVGLATMMTGANFSTRLTSGGDVDLWVNYAGGVPTAGKAVFTIEYIPDVDQ